MNPPNYIYRLKDVTCLDHDSLERFFNSPRSAVIDPEGYVVFYKASTQTWYINSEPCTWVRVPITDALKLSIWVTTLLVDLRDYSRTNSNVTIRALNYNWELSEDRSTLYYNDVDFDDEDYSLSYTIGPYSGRILDKKDFLDTEYRFSSFDLVNQDLVSVQPVDKPTEPSPPLDNTEMNHKIYSPEPNKSNLLDANKSALVAATKLEVGNIALGLVTEQVTKVLPPPLQLLLTDSPLVKIAVANLVNVLISQLNTSDPKILAVNESILTVAYMETLRSFNIESIISNVLSGIPVEKLDLITPKPTE